MECNHIKILRTLSKLDKKWTENVDHRTKKVISIFTDYQRGGKEEEEDWIMSIKLSTEDDTRQFNENLITTAKSYNKEHILDQKINARNYK